MAYEYESDIRSLVIDNPGDIEGRAYDEMEEVYRKAKALDEIVESLSESYVDTYHHATGTTSFNILDRSYLATEVEDIILSYGLKKETEGE